MQIALPVVLLVVVVAVLAVGGVLGVARTRREREAEVTENRVGTLEYVVPGGQDPAPLLAALHLEGYGGLVEDRAAGQVLVVACHEAVDREREHVRAVLAHAPASGGEEPHPGREVRFIDEPHPGSES